jgi:hypothetical protein
VNFTFAYADPSLDEDVSKLYEKEGVVEVGISQVGPHQAVQHLKPTHL